MVLVSPSVDLYCASSGERPPASSSSPPSVVIIATWMGAQKDHIAKYTAGYQQLYPSADILVLRSNTSDYFRSATALKKQLKSAFAIIANSASVAATTDKDGGESVKPRVLLHVFSNGGAITARCLLQAYHASVGSPLPLHTTILDSCPGLANIRGTAVFLKAVLPAVAPIRWILMALIVLGYSGYLLGCKMLKVADSNRRSAEALNSCELVRESRRCYIYSDTDAIINARHVEAHASEASQRGFRVSMEKFSKTKHVSHSRQPNTGRYWSVIQQTWEQSVQKLARL